MKVRLECHRKAQHECFKFFISSGGAPDELRQETKLFDADVQSLLGLLVNEMKRDENLLRMFIRATFEPGLEDNLSLVPDPTGKFVRILYERFKLVTESEVNTIEHLKKVNVRKSFETFMENLLPTYTFRLFHEISSKKLVDKILLEKFKFAVLNDIQTSTRMQVSPSPEKSKLWERAWNKTRKIINTSAQKRTVLAEERKKLNAFEASEYLVDGTLEDDDIVHTVLGRLSDYLTLDSKANRERIFQLLNELTGELKKQWTTVTSMKEYKKLREKQIFLRSTKEDTEHKMEEKFKKIRCLTEAVKGDESYQKYEFSVKFLMMPLITFLLETENEDESIKQFRSEWEKLNERNPVNLKSKGLQKVVTSFDQQLYDIIVFKLVESLLRSEIFMKDFHEKILHSGLALKSCRYFLAKVFDINLRVYMPTESGTFELFENFNESAEINLSVSIEDANEQRFYQKLVINEDFVKLDEILTTVNRQHRVILTDIESFTSIANLENYISEGGFAQHFKHKEKSNSGLTPASAQKNEEEKKKSGKKSNSYLYTDELKEAWDEFVKKGKLKKELPNQFILNTTPQATEKYQPDKLQINDEFLVKMICKFFPKFRRSDIESRLHLVSCTVTGSSQILHAILNCLHVDGVKIAAGELLTALNIISNCFNIKQTRFFDTFSWMFMSCPQHEWLLEFVLFQVEFYLQKPIKRSEFDANFFLKKVAGKEILILLAQKLLIDDEKVIEEDLRGAIKSLEFISMNALDEISKLSIRSWKYASTKEFFDGQVKLLTKVSEENQKKICFYLTQMQNVFGTETIVEFLKLIVVKRLTVENDAIIRIVRQFYSNEWNLSNDVIKLLTANSFNTWEDLLNENFSCKNDERTVEDMIRIIKNNPNISTDLMNELESYKRSVNDIYQSQIMKFNEDDLKDWSRKTIIEMISALLPSLENSRKMDEKIAAVTRAIMVSTADHIKLRR